MPLMFDRMTASVVGAVVFLLLFGLQMRVQGGRIEDSLVYSAKKQTLDFADMIERDLANIGYLSTPGDDVIIEHTSAASDSANVTDKFEFWGLGEAGGRSQIRYAAVQADSAYVIDKWVPAYQIQRFEKVGAAWNMTGGSSAHITKFTIQLLDENSNVAVPTNARQIRVRIGNAVAVNPMSQKTEHNSLLAGREMKWGITLSPRGLRQQGYQG